MKKRKSKNFHILIVILLIIIVGFLLIRFLQKPVILTPQQHLEQILSPALRATYPPSKSLQNQGIYQAGFIPAETLKWYILAFSDDNDYGDTFSYLIQFQQGLNGIGLQSALTLDRALAESLAIAAEKAIEAGENDAEACSYFNSLLNPALLVMDLTLWTGKSQIYPVLQQNRDVGIQCEFYYPQLSHGMFTYDVRTGRIVQRSVFCDPSENKSKCLGVWDYFWKFAADPLAGPINYGVGCSLTDWMNQGFVCTHGVDIWNNTLVMNTIFSLDGTALLHIEIKDEFQNALGANGKTIIDNVKQKCAKVKEKSSKYGSIVPTLTGAGSSLTSGVISTATAATGTGEGLKEEYEKAMLFASLFSEACTANPSDLAKDLAGGGGAGQFGLNKPNACILSATPELGATGLKEEMQCVNHFFGPRGLEQVQNLDGLPDNQCLPSASQDDSQETEEPSCRERGETGGECGQPATEQQERAVEESREKSKRGFQTTDGRADNAKIVIFKSEDAKKVCGLDTAVACVNKDENILYLNEDLVSEEADSTAPTNVPSPLNDQTVYDRSTAIGHEVNHLNLPFDSHPEIYKKDVDFGNFVPAASQPSPDQLEPDECSAQAQKIDAVADCLEQSQMRNFLGKEGGKIKPDPLPPGDEVGGTPVPACDEAGESGGAGGYFGTKKNSADNCIIGDFCDFSAWGAVSSRTGFNKKCRFVQSEDEQPCPPLQ